VSARLKILTPELTPCEAHQTTASTRLATLCPIFPTNQPNKHTNKELTKGGDLCEAQVDVPFSE
jgi:hypothetical protein